MAQVALTPINRSFVADATIKFLFRASGSSEVGQFMRVIVDHAVCTGHARCQECCPEVFATDEMYGKVVLLLEEVPQHLYESARLAVRNCPEGAIALSDTPEIVEKNK
jgi:ferredoxin